MIKHENQIIDEIKKQLLDEVTEIAFREKLVSFIEVTGSLMLVIISLSCILTDPLAGIVSGIISVLFAGNALVRLVKLKRFNKGIHNILDGISQAALTRLGD